MPGILRVVLEDIILNFFYDGHSEVWHLGIAFRKIPRPRGLSVLDSQFQDRSVREHIYS